MDRLGIEIPLKEKHTDEEAQGALARITDEDWLRRQLRAKQYRELDDYMRCNGFVHLKGELYVSNVAFDRRREQLARNKRLLELMEADNQAGQVYTLAELAELSPSNPFVRRSELMVRLRGFEDAAANSEEQFTDMFYTLTCPSRFHPVLIAGTPNPYYVGSTVKDAQDYLNKVWQRIRAQWDRLGIRCFGMRIVEPHHDGTPHWHLLLFIPKELSELATTEFKRYALAMDGNEPGAQEHRVKVVHIDPTKGSATGYIAKYVAKNIDGKDVGVDHYDRNAIHSALRIDAWKSAHGIRQFQQIGGASVTVWRELRRLDADGIEPTLIKQLIVAADESDWETYNALMGGVICKLQDRPVRPMIIQREKSNRYNEAITAIKGILFGTKAIVSRPYEWIVRHVDSKPAMPKLESIDGIGFGAALSTAPPATRAPLEFCQ